MNAFFYRRSLAVLGLMAAATLAMPAEGAEKLKANQPAAAKVEKDSFVRVERDAAGKPLAMQTAIVHFESDAPDRKGVVIDLVGAVHIGEKSYYEELNKRFEDYDAVLYEMVAPEGTRIPKGSKPGGVLSSVQNGMKDLLGLEHQLQYVDYTASNMVHADMSPEDFLKSMSDRGESMGSIMMRMLTAGLAKQSSEAAAGKSTDAELLLALFDSNRALRLKQIVADQFSDMEAMMAGFNGPDGSTLLTERNKVALGKLEKQLAKGSRHVAIFYGAGHLPDMAKKLTTDFNFHRTGEEWLSAWNLADPAPGKAAQSGKAAAAAQ